jgi:hypothetical protein
VGWDFSLILAREEGPETVDNDLRASLVAAGAAAALSALVGVLAGVGFLALVFRAALGGILIGAAVYGAAALLRKTVPGLLSQDGAAAVAGGEAMGKGGKVDILLPGEEDSTESFVIEGASQRYSPDGLPIDGQDAILASAGLDAEGEAVDEDAIEISPVDTASLLGPEEPDGKAEAAIPANSAPAKGQPASVGFDELDILPDLEGFSDSFTASEFSSSGSLAESAARGFGGQGASEQLGQEKLDPASLAQAVRTILKRDQKG